MRGTFAGSESAGRIGRPWSTQHDSSDQALIEKVASGNRLAMQVLFARHHTRVYRFVLRLIGNEALAEDVTSEVFLTLWRQAHRFKARSAVTTWLLAIARYKALAEVRRRPEITPVESAEASDPSDDPEVALLTKRRGEIVRRCLRQLSREHREIIDLVYYHEKTVHEVADIVGIPGNTVKTRMFYARRKLAELLEAEGVVGALS
jgi:RNA polymerase sigma-70 factor, ECF subfamily